MNSNYTHEGPAASVTVTLVHGTGARKAPWTRSDSALSCAIRHKSLGKIVLTRFLWSGSNSHTARLRAGQELAEHLQEVIAENPTAKHHVVAHSHGGNVAMYALRDAYLKKRIASLICLATPFIELKRRTLNTTVDMLREFPNPLFACIFSAFVSFAFGTVGQSILVLPVIFVIAIAFLFSRKTFTFLSDRLEVKLKRSQDRLMSKFALPALAGLRMRVVSADRDEAAIYLNVVDRIAGLPFMLWSPRVIFWSAWIWVWLSLPWALAGIHLSTFGPTASEHGWSLEETLFTAFLFGLLVIVFMAGLLVVFSLFSQATMAVWAKMFRGHALGFGEKNIIENWLIHIAATSAPADTGKMTKKSFVVSTPGLRHSVYGDEKVIETVANWIAKDS